MGFRTSPKRQTGSKVRPVYLLAIQYLQKSYEED